jgi:hypothetical protein
MGRYDVGLFAAGEKPTDRGIAGLRRAEVLTDLQPPVAGRLRDRPTKCSRNGALTPQGDGWRQPCSSSSASASAPARAPRLQTDESGRNAGVVT